MVHVRGSTHGPLELLRRALPYQPNSSLINSTIFFLTNCFKSVYKFEEKGTDLESNQGPPAWYSSVLTTRLRRFDENSRISLI